MKKNVDNFKNFSKKLNEQEELGNTDSYGTNWKSDDIVLLVADDQPYVQPIKWGDLYISIGMVEDSLQESSDGGTYAVHLKTFIDDGGSLTWDNNNKAQFNGGGGVRKFHIDEFSRDKNITTREVDTN